MDESSWQKRLPGKGFKACIPGGKRTGFQTEKRKNCQEAKKNSSSDFAGESERKLFQRRASLHKILFTVYEKNRQGMCIFMEKAIPLC